MFEKVVVVDAAGHLLGRLASLLAKELLCGQKIVVVRTEEINISGSLFRNQLIFSKFMQKRCNTNPRRGPYHFRAPGRILYRAIRGMIPHKTKRGQAALDRLKLFEGCPHPYDKIKKQVLPAALRVLRLKPGRKFCRLGDLAKAYGWAHDGLIKSLEEKRKTKSAAYYATKKQLGGLRALATANLKDKLAAIDNALPFTSDIAKLQQHSSAAPSAKGAAPVAKKAAAPAAAGKGKAAPAAAAGKGKAK